MKILVLTGSYFPYGAAMSSRVSNFCRLFYAAGYSVHVIAPFSKESIMINHVENLEYCTYQITSSLKPSSRTSFFGVDGYCEEISSYLNSNRCDLIFVAGVEPYYNRIIRLSKQKQIPVIAEQCEWMDKSSYTFGLIDYRKIRRDYLLMKGYKRTSAIIAISRLLYNHYKSIGIRSIRIPTILDVNNIEWTDRNENDRKRIIYTGNPGKSKEFLKPIIYVFKNNKHIQKAFEFHIFGPDKSTVASNTGIKVEDLRMLSNCVYIHGMVSQLMIYGEIRASDYQIFLRPERRSSDAGFPTKMGESFSVGTPIITNMTGDIELYMRDGVEGYYVNDVTEDDVLRVFERIMDASEEECRNMRICSRNKAEVAFNYLSYVDDVKQLLEECIQNEPL